MSLRWREDISLRCWPFQRMGFISTQNGVDGRIGLEVVGFSRIEN